MAKSIQFQGRDKLIDGFKNTHAKGWSVWDGRDMLTKGIGAEMLDQFLSCLEEGSTNTIYTLKIYEDIEDAKQIKMGTDPDGSFKFLLDGDADEITSSLYSQRNNSNKLFQRLAMLEETQIKIGNALEKITGTGEEEEAEEEPQTIGAIAIDMFKNPAKLREFAESVHMIRTLFSPNAPAAYIPQSIGSVNQQSQPMTPEESIIRAQAAISTLEKHDENFIEHMETLAAIAEHDKPQFQVLLSLLDKMKK